VADLSLDKLMLQGALKKIVRPERRRELVRYTRAAANSLERTVDRARAQGQPIQLRDDG
jgi:hypothetical protein